jgi:hypothetical protein
MDLTGPRVLYINKMTQGDHESLHVMFEDGSMLRIQVESNASSDEQDPIAAREFLQKIEQLISQYPHSEEEVYPICLGDTTCMYCNGKGCINCRR